MSLRSAILACLPETQWGDRLHALLNFRHRQRRWPDRAKPTRFNDYLYRMKVDGSLQDPLRMFVTDKEYVKFYIAGLVGSEHVITTYRVLRDGREVEELTLDRFPCIIKPTHLSGEVEVHTDSAKTVNHEKLKRWFDINHYKTTREQNYRGLRPKIIVEEFVSDDGQTIPEDYKIFCFGGIPKLIQVDSDRFSGHKRNLYDTSWNRLPFSLKFPCAPEEQPRPPMLAKMLDLAARLSEPFSFIRVDMYTAGTRLKIGELTNCPGSAEERIQPPAGEFTLGCLFAE